jgi:hypothetical protein
MSATSHNVEYTGNSLLTQQMMQPTTTTSTIAELRQRALVNKSDAEKYSVKRWVNSVYTLYEQASLVATRKREARKRY